MGHTKSAKDRKDDVMRFRVTRDQRKIIEAAAENAGLEPSVWVRLLALRAARGELVPPTKSAV